MAVADSKGGSGGRDGDGNDLLLSSSSVITVLSSFKDPKLAEYFGWMQFDHVEVIIFKEKVWVPEDLHLRLIDWYHKILGHTGSTRTIGSIGLSFGFPGLRSKVEDLIQSCDTCQCHKKSQESLWKASSHLSVMQQDTMGMHTHWFNRTLDSDSQRSCYNA